MHSRLYPVMVFLLVAFGAGIIPVAYSQQYPMELSTTDKLFGLSKVWQELENQSVSVYRNEGPDSDSLYRAYIPLVLNSANDYEYYRLLQRFLASFNDPFTRVEMPHKFTDSILSPPLEIQEARGRYFVSNADKKLAGRIPPGSEIHRFNGYDISVYLENEVIPYISAGTPQQRKALALEALTSGWMNTQFLLSFTTPEGKNSNEVVERLPGSKIQWSFPRSTFSSTDPLTLDWIERDIALITLNRLDETTLISFPDIQQLVRARVLLLDLRSCRQGEHLISSARLALRFLEQSWVVLPGFGTRNQPCVIQGKGVDQSFGKPTGGPLFSYTLPDTLFGDSSTVKYSMPLIVITGATTANNAEHFLAMLLQQPGRAKLIGETTAGSTGASVKTVLPGGGWVHIGARFDFYPGADTWFEQGITPDIIVVPDIKSLLNGEDMVLKRAIQLCHQ